MPITFKKRQKEIKRAEKRREKEERREQKKLAKRAELEAGKQPQPEIVSPETNEPASH
jgi:hypothetical protein